eukprot:COSAG01_NODE_5017_length_4524_cov_3.064836_8_plen_57_part_00
MIVSWAGHACQLSIIRGCHTVLGKARSGCLQRQHGHHVHAPPGFVHVAAVRLLWPR